MSNAKAQNLRIGVLCVASDPRVQALLFSSIAYDSSLELLGTAPGIESAVRMVTELRPDVVALDMSLCMARLEHSIRQLKRAGAGALIAMGTGNPALIALDSGADDYLPVPLSGSEIDNSTFLHDTVNRIKVATAGVRLPSIHNRQLELIVVAGSRGGPAPLAALLSRLSGRCPPVVAALHGAAVFGDMPTQLQAMTGRDIIVVQDAQPVEPGCVYLPANGCHIAVERVDGERWAVVRRTPPQFGRLPSADVLFRSAVRSGCTGVAGILLSEGGRDGLEGLQSLCRNGALAYQRDERTTLLEAEQTGIRVRPLEDITREMLEMCEVRRGNKA